MTKKSDDYEKFIESLIKNIKDSGRKIEKLYSGRQNYLKGASGQKHQIDVSFFDYSCSKPTLVLIECKRWERKRIPVSVPKIITYNHNDIKKIYDDYDVKILILSTNDLQRGAKKIVDYEGINFQKVNPEPPYGFSYEDFILLANKDDVNVEDVPNVEITENKGE